MNRGRFQFNPVCPSAALNSVWVPLPGRGRGTRIRDKPQGKHASLLSRSLGARIVRTSSCLELGQVGTQRGHSASAIGTAELLKHSAPRTGPMQPRL
eukprot:scaffold1680_cov391-Prasinococcus_capsulatus_cf.AAC.3